jgi:3-phenylpropionate/trans-cinnamate dioxygenase ferredoxin subunit
VAWVAAGEPEAIAEGEVAVVDVDGRKIALCHTLGAFYAVDDVCSHDGGPLGQGHVDGKRIECPRHGAMFDVTTGKPLTLPAVRPIKSYETRVVDGQVEVNIP